MRNTTSNALSTILSHCTKCINLLFETIEEKRECHLYPIQHKAPFSVPKTHMFILLCFLLQSKVVSEIPSKDHNVFEFFSIALYTDCLTDHHKKFQIAFPYDIDIENYNVK